MTSRYASPEDFKRSLEARLSELGVREGRGLRRERQVVIFERFLVRTCEGGDSELVVKGGMAVELRTARARATRDIDLRALGSPERFAVRLGEIGATELEDFMTFRVEPHARPELESPGMKYPGKRFRVQALLAGKVYGDPFAVDVAFGEPMHGAAERVPGRTDLRFAGIEAPSFAVYPLVTHLAEKLHAYTLPRPSLNSRVKDLPDIAILASIGSLDSDDVRTALEQTFVHRGTHALMSALPEAPVRWQEPYRKLAEDNRLRWQTLEDVCHAARTFLEPVLRGEFGRWEPERWSWDSRSRRAGERDRAAAEWVFERAELRGGAYVAQLRGPDGSRRELEGYRPGNDDVRAGDVVRLGDAGALVLVGRGQGRDRGR